MSLLAAVTFSTMELLVSTSHIWLFFGGIVIGVLAILLGGTMFFSIPLFQFLFPGLSLGGIVGNIKVGSVIRSISASSALWKKVSLNIALPFLLPLVIGSAIGALSIASVSQNFVLPALIVAIILSEAAGVISRNMPRSLMHVFSFGFGLFGGILGAGIGAILPALVRMRIPDDAQIVDVRAIAVFLELSIHIVAVIVLLFAGVLDMNIWLPWSAGSLIGGYIGGRLIVHTGKLSGTVQRWMLRGVFLFAIALAVWRIL